MSSNKVFFLVFGVLALVFAVSMSADVAEQDNDVISDRRYRWDSSEQDLEDDDSAAHDDDDDAQDDDDQSGSGEFEEIEIWELAPASEESEEASGSDESGSDEA